MIRRERQPRQELFTFRFERSEVVGSRRKENDISDALHVAFRDSLILQQNKLLCSVVEEGLELCQGECGISRRKGGGHGGERFGA